MREVKKAKKKTEVKKATADMMEGFPAWRRAEWKKILRQPKKKLGDG